MSTASPVLPDLEEARVAELEERIFARIADDRTRSRAHRRRWWTAGGAAAAVVAVTVIVAPFVTSSLGGAASSTVQGASSEGMPDMAVIPHDGRAPLAPVEIGGADGMAASGGEASSARDSLAGEQGREIVATGSASVTVENVAAAARSIRADAEARGGYVESMSIGAQGVPVEPFYDGRDIMPAPVGDDSGWVSVRVPADQLSDAIDALSEVGEVTSSTVTQSDVTDQAVDLRARIAASEASVARLTDLMASAESVADLITAESALAERQATLDADRQMLESLESSIALSSLSVQLTLRHQTVQADPAGFTDGLVAGWNGLVATVNGLVVAFGFLLPWLLIAAVVGAIVWGVTRSVRGRRRRAAPEE